MPNLPHEAPIQSGSKKPETDLEAKKRTERKKRTKRVARDVDKWLDEIEPKVEGYRTAY